MEDASLKFELAEIQKAMEFCLNMSGSLSITDVERAYFRLLMKLIGSKK